MSYRCLMIVNPARIRCKNEQLLIETEEVHPTEPENKRCTVQCTVEKAYRYAICKIPLACVLGG